MFIDPHLVLTFLGLVALTGLLGWSVDVWWRTKAIWLYPLYGLFVFGAIVVPGTYLLGHFSMPVMASIMAVIVLAALVKAQRLRWRVIAFSWTPSGMAVVGVYVIFVCLALLQASKYGVPGGADSTVHSGIINGVLIQSHSLRGTYPLGLHLFILFSERIFNVSQATVFLGFYVLLQLSILLSISTIAYRLCGRVWSMLIALAVGSIDVSIFNNLLNGSATHLLGILIMSQLVVVAILVRQQSFLTRLVVLAMALTSAWYYHYPSLFFAIPGLWAWRLATRESRTWVYLAALGTALIASFPLQVSLFQDPAYFGVVMPGMATIVLGELLLWYFGRSISRFIMYRFVLLLITGLSIFVFIKHFNSFLYLPTWYGIVLLIVAGIGAIVTVVRPTVLGVSALLAGSAMTVIFALLTSTKLASQTSVMVELVYYFGYTYSLIMLGTNGLYQLHGFGTNRRLRQAAVSAIAIFIIFIIVSRSFDRPLLQSMFTNDQPISRYGSSKGFAILYTKNDVSLAEWVKKNIPNDGIVYNPGGLYNSWATLTEHQVAFATYNAPTFNGSDVAISTFKKLIQGQPNVDVQLLLDRNIRYILLPEAYSVAIYNSRLVLLKQIGGSRLYRLTETASGEVIPFPIMSQSDVGITVATDGSYSCRYCGDTFYFTDQDSMKQLTLAPHGTMTITLPEDMTNPDNQITLFLDHSIGMIDYRTDTTSDWKTTSTESLAIYKIQSTNTRSIQVRNSSTVDSLSIYSAAIQLTK